MPKLSGAFEHFKNLSNIIAPDVQRWLKFRVEVHTLENFIGNRVLYPQSIPTTKAEMEIDLAILREVVRLNSSFFYDPVRTRLVIPQDFINRFLDLTDLVWVFVDALPLKQLTKVFVKDWSGNHLIGSILKLTPQSQADLAVVLDNKSYKLNVGSLTALPFLKKEGLLTVNSHPLAVSGGEAGVFVDLRK
jgi:hypothetical protein